jgi:hypothetical protein
MWLEYLAGSWHIDEIVVNLHHRPESVQAALGMAVVSASSFTTLKSR